MKALKEPEDDLVSGAVIAKTLGLDPATIRRWRREHAPCHRMGNNLIRYKLSEIVAWRISREPVHTKEWLDKRASEVTK
jgi:hypothetical protein